MELTALTLLKRKLSHEKKLPKSRSQKCWSHDPNQQWFYLCSSMLFCALNMRLSTPIVVAILWHLSLGFSCFYSVSTPYFGEFTLKLNSPKRELALTAVSSFLCSIPLYTSIAYACFRLDTYTWVSSQCLKLNISLSIPFPFLFLEMILFFQTLRPKTSEASDFSDSQTQNFKGLWFFTLSCFFLRVP